MKDVFKYIEGFELSKDSFLNFVTTLCDYFSEKFDVRRCPVKIMKQYKEGLPPARHGYRVKLHEDGKTERIDECIEFREDLQTANNKGRILKLVAHEWMHFYDGLVMWGELDIEKVGKDYQQLIMQSQAFIKNIDSTREKYDSKTWMFIDKLSAKEVVADKFAQEFLKEVKANITDEILEKQIEMQIQKHEEQIEEYSKILKAKNIQEENVLI